MMSGVSSLQSDSCMTDNIPHTQRITYRSAVAIWLILLIALRSSIVAFDLQRARTHFFEEANQLYQQANGRVPIVESILEGFTAMVSVTNDPGGKLAGINNFPSPAFKPVTGLHQSALCITGRATAGLGNYQLGKTRFFITGRSFYLWRDADLCKTLFS